MDDSELAYHHTGPAEPESVAARLTFLRELVAAERWQDAVRELDLENHLPSEGASEAPSPEPVAPEPVAEADTNEPLGLGPTHLGVARSVPSDPSGGPDLVLSVAYQMLRDQLKKGP